MTRNTTTTLAATCTFALLAASGCGTPAMTAADMAKIGPAVDLAPENLDIGTPVPVATNAVVTTVAFGSMGNPGSGHLTTVGLTDQKVTKAIDTSIGSDNFVRAEGGKVLVLDHTNGTLRVYDPKAGFKAPVEIKTGDMTQKAATSNPHDVALVPASSKALVTLYGNDAAHAVGLIDLATPAMGVVKWIALPQAMKDPDGKPEASEIHLCGGFAFVTVQDLDETNFAFTPTGPGRIIAIDLAKDAVDTTMGVITLMGANPNGFSRDGTGCDIVLTADAGSQFKAPDGGGGIERVDLTLRKSLGMVIKDSDLKGHPREISAKSKTLAYANLTLIEKGAPMDKFIGNQVVAIDPSTGKLLGTISQVGSFIAFAQVSPDKSQLFVGVHDPDFVTMMPKIGVYVVPADGTTKLGATPLDIGQGPYAIAFY
ncbi:MAG: hypothetical protein EXR72_25765 [Myxococcales bacterium]|nr:hypothetical protein [Myxococcales bacterium]